MILLNVSKDLLMQVLSLILLSCCEEAELAGWLLEDVWALVLDDDEPNELLMRSEPAKSIKLILLVYSWTKPLLVEFFDP